MFSSLAECMLHLRKVSVAGIHLVPASPSAHKFVFDAAVGLVRPPPRRSIDLQSETPTFIGRESAAAQGKRQAPRSGPAREIAARCSKFPFRTCLAPKVPSSRSARFRGSAEIALSVPPRVIRVGVHRLFARSFRVLAPPFAPRHQVGRTGDGGAYRTNGGVSFRGGLSGLRCGSTNRRRRH